MRALVETNDPVLLSFLEALLRDAGIEAAVLDRNISAVEGSIGVELKSETPTFVSVAQDRGEMEFSGFSRRRMKKVETFTLEVVPATEP